MRDYPAMTDEMLAWARAHQPAEDVPAMIKMGRKAQERLLAILGGQRRIGPDLLRVNNFYQMLNLTGLPIHVQEDWPENLFVVIDGAGRAVIAGVLNEPAPAAVEGTDA